MEQRDLARSVNYLMTVGQNKDVAYSVQTTNVADLTFGQAAFGSGKKDLFLPTNKIETEPLNVQFLVSSDHREWIYFYKWMLKCKNNDSAHLNEVMPCEVTALDANGERTTKFIYLDCFPLSLEGLQYTSIGQSVVLTSSVTLRYNQMKIIDVNGEEISDDWNGEL